MSMKNIYIAEDHRNYGDYFTIAITFDKQEAIEAAQRDFDHLTARERKNREIIVEVYEIECLEGQSAKEAWDAYNEENGCMPDSDVIEIISD